ncbi:MAG: lysylphosphatidylglycerol synthase transmembrane domain-containing protein [Pseudomonadota bacterium]
MWKHYLVGIIISLVAGWFFAKTVDFSQMGQALAGMHLVWLIPCTVLYIVSYVFRSLRWHYLMRPVARVPFRPLFSALMIGFLGNNLLPAHLGEFVRAYVLGRDQGVSKSATFATVVLERVYDGLTVLFLLMIVLLFMDLPDRGVAGSHLTAQGLRTAGWAGLAVFAGLMAALQLLRWQRARMLGVCRFCLRPLPGHLSDRILEMVAAFADGLAVARAGDLLWIILHSLLVWVFLGLYAWSLMPAFGLSLGPLAGLLMEVVIALALLIPSAPAFLGTFHLAAAFTLGYMGADAGVAGSYAMVLWLVHFVSTTAIGAWFLWREGLGWRALSGAADK